jgi:hypothetical protein
MNSSDHQGLPYATAGSLIRLAGVKGISASLSRSLSLPAA